MRDVKEKELGLYIHAHKDTYIFTHILYRNSQHYPVRVDRSGINKTGSSSIDVPERCYY